ncbi:hypothetical protein Rhal01_00395 [Rubritalea halochordaticola]|uniref:MgtC/SapB family protein n=1 Tax=Rubritalea halochordaticola TaxID=714537 RepID=A0ABP9UUS4_9BACT
MWQETQAYFLSLALGLLIGLQREVTKSHSAGIRTFTLITLLGSAAATLGVWQTCVALLAVAVILAVGAIHPNRNTSTGLTTEVACLLSFFIGALLVNDERIVALLLAGCCLVLLQTKRPLHAFSSQLNREDLHAIARLSLLVLIVLPLLPNRSFGPHEAINPFKIWLMVVLIVGISLVAYFASKYFGEKKGAVAAGILGGLISSTATTVSFSRQAKATPSSAGTVTVLILMISSTIVFARVLFEIALVALTDWLSMATPLIFMMLWMALISTYISRGVDKNSPNERRTTPPSEFTVAVIFGIMYAAVLYGVAVANDNYGSQGVYVVAAISGLTDMDAITLSSAQMVATDTLEPAIAWRSILIGGMANLVFKGVIASILGPKELVWPLMKGFGASLAGGLVILLTWPH